MKYQQKLQPALLRLMGILVFSGIISYAIIPQQQVLKVDDAVRMALATDGRIEGSLAELAASHARLEEERRRHMYPSLSVSANYTRLSHTESSIDFGGTAVSFGSNDNIYTMAADLAYPVFSGFRAREALKLARLQQQSDEIYTAVLRSTVAFEARRAYWEVLRGVQNNEMLRENLEITRRNLAITSRKFAEGTVLKADLLEARMRFRPGGNGSCRCSGGIQSGIDKSGYPYPFRRRD